MTDPLTRSSAALRKHTDTPNLRSGLTRARLLDNAAKRYSGRRRFALRWLVPVASVFVVGTALARVAESWPALREIMTFSPAAPGSPPPRAAKRKRPASLAPAPAGRVPHMPAADAGSTVVSGLSVADASEPLAQDSSTAQVREPSSAQSARAARGLPLAVGSPSPKRAPVPASAPTRTSRSAVSAHQTGTVAGGVVAPPAGSASEPAAASGELALFRRAQALHLAHDTAAALAAWDAYLRVAVHGVLLPEARYNRALCLIRLGRNVEARAALEPFAQAEAPGYRRVEARALLAALPH